MEILPNGVAVIESDTHHRVWIQECGKLAHDEWMSGIIRDIVNPGDICVNAGGHIGTLCSVMLDCGAAVHAFEPNPDAFQCLKYNCPKATASQSALGEVRGKTRIVQCDNAGASFLSDEGGPEVNVFPLDYFELRPNFILLDCEGWEIQVLKGAEQTIRFFHPVMIIEVNSGALQRAGGSENELLELISFMNYTWEILQPESKVGDPQYDVLCYPIAS